MSLNQSLISQNIIADLKGPKYNINCTMVDVRGDVIFLLSCIPNGIAAGLVGLWKDIKIAMAAWRE